MARRTRKGVVFKGKRYYTNTYLHEGLKAGKNEIRQADFLRAIHMRDTGSIIKTWVKDGFISKTGTTRAKYIKTTPKGNQLLRLLNDPSKSKGKIKRIEKLVVLNSNEDKMMTYLHDPYDMSLDTGNKSRDYYAKKLGVSRREFSDIINNLRKQNLIAYDNWDMLYYIKRKGLNYLKGKTGKNDKSKILAEIKQLEKEKAEQKREYFNTPAGQRIGAYSKQIYLDEMNHYNYKIKELKRKLR